jgi:hypothetical protein
MGGSRRKGKIIKSRRRTKNRSVTKSAALGY